MKLEEEVFNICHKLGLDLGNEWESEILVFFLGFCFDGVRDCRVRLWCYIVMKNLSITFCQGIGLYIRCVSLLLILGLERLLFFKKRLERLY